MSHRAPMDHERHYIVHSRAVERLREHSKGFEHRGDGDLGNDIDDSAYHMIERDEVELWLQKTGDEIQENLVVRLAFTGAAHLYAVIVANRNDDAQRHPYVVLSVIDQENYDQSIASNYWTQDKSGLRGERLHQSPFEKQLADVRPAPANQVVAVATDTSTTLLVTWIENGAEASERVPGEGVVAFLDSLINKNGVQPHPIEVWEHTTKQPRLRVQLV